MTMSKKSFSGFKVVCSYCKKPLTNLSSYCNPKCEANYQAYYEKNFAKLIKWDLEHPFIKCTLKQCDERKKIELECEALKK